MDPFINTFNHKGDFYEIFLQCLIHKESYNNSIAVDYYIIVINGQIQNYENKNFGIK